MLNLLQKRRSIRRYTDEKIEAEKLKQIIQSGLLAPSSKSIRPWSFLIVSEQDKLAKLPQARQPEMVFARSAQAAVLVLADTTKSDVWVEDCSIAAVLMQLEATALGLGSCWIQVRNRQSAIEGKSTEAYLREQFAIPEHIAVESIITIGYPAEEKKPVALEKLLYDQVYEGQYGERYFTEEEIERA